MFAAVTWGLSCNSKMSDLHSTESCAPHPEKVWCSVKETPDVFCYAEIAPWAQHTSGEGETITASCAVRFPPPWGSAASTQQKQKHPSKERFQKQSYVLWMAFTSLILHPRVFFASKKGLGWFLYSSYEHCHGSSAPPFPGGWETLCLRSPIFLRALLRRETPEKVLLPHQTSVLGPLSRAQAEALLPQLVFVSPTET